MAIEKREGRDTYTQATHTRCVVEFHSDDNPGTDAIVVGADNGSHPRLGHLIGVRTSKTLGAASGSFSVTIKKPTSFARQISLLRIWKDPEDVWVRIYWIVEGQRIHVMTGLIDSINESMSRDADGKRVEAYTIDGRDFGKVFETMQLWVNLPGAGIDAPASIARYLNSAVPKAPNVGTPGAWIKWWLEGWVANGGLAEVQWQLPRSLGGCSFYDALDLKNIQDMDEGNGLLAEGTAYEPDLENGFGKLWDKMVEYSNDVLNELWVDLDSESDGDRPMMVYLRERPFPTRLSGKSKWAMVKQHILEKSDVYQRNLAKGGPASRFNYWSMSTDGRLVAADERALVMNGRIDSAKPGQPGGVPIWNEESIIKHGVRKWEQTTIFLGGMIASGSAAENAWPKVLANWLRRCHDWYVATPMQLSGTITTSRALPEIHIGQRLLEKRDEGAIEYYIEGVENSWTYPNASRTSLTVTYGTYEREDLLGFIYRQMEDPKSVRLKDCSAHSTSLQGTVDFITQNCRFEPHSGDEDIEFVLTHGGDGFEVGGGGISSVSDVSALESAGKSMLEEGAANVFGGNKPQSEPSMIPTPDIENDQARELATGSTMAFVRKPPGAPFGADQLRRNEDPLAGYDEPEATDDPTFGLSDE